MSSSKRAPKADYELTGETRPPKEGEFFLNEINGEVLIAGYGRGEPRQIMRLIENKKDNLVATVKVTAVSSVDPDLAEAAQSAAGILKRYLAGEKVEPEKVRIATQTLQSYQKMKAVEIAEKALVYSMVKDVAKDKDDLKRMIGANVKQLGQ
jgi:ABC-type Zn uptake system ZnuABC Zn-binding protein ZnuA